LTQRQPLKLHRKKAMLARNCFGFDTDALTKAKRA
jgi:hypothetical protein